MPKFRDLSGQKFGLLTAISVIEENNRKEKYNCVCDCNPEGIIIIASGSLRDGKTRSCGCLRRATAGQHMKERMLDLNNQIFGNLTILGLSHIDEKYGTYWHAKCRCGNEIIRRGVYFTKAIVKGNISSCGCLDRLDLAGQTFNKLTGVKYLYTKRNKAIWSFDCSCGNKNIELPATEVKNGHTKSCGCARSDSAKIAGQKQVIPMIGKNFGKLTVEKLDHIKNENTSSVLYMYKCLCSCGNTTIVCGKNLRKGNVKSCGCYVKEYWQTRLGPNHPCWRHDLSDEDRKLLVSQGRRDRTPEYYAWTSAVKKRDKYTCQVSGIKTKKGFGISCHHYLNFVSYIPGQYDPDNGVVILTKLHVLFHRLYGNRNNTREQFEDFKTRYQFGEWRDYQI